MRRTILLFIVLVASGSALIMHAQETKREDAQPRAACVAVLGAVNQPGRFVLQRQVRLLEVVAFAGGVTQNAGDMIRITSTGAQCPMESKPEIRTNTPAPKIRTYQTTNVLHGDEESNPYLEGGDVVVIIEAECVYVVGAVAQPRKMFLKGNTTLTQAIAYAGGALKSALIDHVRIIRQQNSGERVELIVDLNKARKDQQRDPVLQPNDIIDVPSRFGHPGPIFDPGLKVPNVPAPVNRVIYEWRAGQ